MTTAVEQPAALERQSFPANGERARGFDLLRVPLLGRFLRWRGSRLALQTPLFGLSLMMIAHAFFGPDIAPKNLAALLTWVHFRGLVVVVILLAGNLFCMACPFLVMRDLARRWITPRWEWPRSLRNKWPSVALFVAVLFVYELFDLFSSPFWTGVLIVLYFGLATLVDLLFRRASFCKYLCPVGQFNFLSSTMAPLEVSVRDASICQSCQSKDCIRGVQIALPSRDGVTGLNMELPVIQRGCELALFQPRKVDNLDCTFCLDCVYACPHDNVGIVARLPSERLTHSGPRSGLGTIERRPDFTALITVFTFGALLNAFAMISPVYALEQAVAQATGLRVEWPILSGLFAFALIVEPAVLLGAAAFVTRWWSGTREGVLPLVKRFSRSLIPIGFGVWLAHYAFHFLTGFLTVIPVFQNAVRESFGTALLGKPMWQLGGLPEAVVFPIEVGFLGLGLIGSWAATWTITGEVATSRRNAAFLPWAAVHLTLFVVAVWIMTQPMDMRGTFLGG
ncbi:FesM [bacterium]|nr:FesM [bacterium]